MSKPDGGPAFPQNLDNHRVTADGNVPSSGMSLLDVLTAVAFSGLIPRLDGHLYKSTDLVKDACTLARMMLAEMEKYEKTA